VNSIVGRLVRSIIGLDINAAKEAFGEFLQKDSLHPDQIAFVNEVIDYLVKNGSMEPKEMFDAPFTHYHDHGLTGVMGEEMAMKVVNLVRQINENAEVA